MDRGRGALDPERGWPVSSIAKTLRDRFMKLLIWSAVIVVGVVGYWKLAFPTYAVRYRMTLQAEVDGRPVTGSGVIEVDYDIHPSWLVDLLGNTLFEAHVKGEAIPLDLGPKGVLFATMAYRFRPPPAVAGTIFDYTGVLFTQWPVFEKRGYTAVDVLRTIRQIGALSGSRDLPLDHTPIFVRFRNISDPSTIEEVDPTNLSASFGPGVKLDRVTLTITHDPVTRGISKNLPWIDDLLSGKLLLHKPPPLARGEPIPQLPQEGAFIYLDLKKGIEK